MVLEKLITLEDVNSLLNMNENFSMDYIINTGLIPKESFETGFEDYVYDFNIINMSKEKGDVKLTTESISKTAIFSLKNPINNYIINFKIMLESNNINSNYMGLRFLIGDEILNIDLINELDMEINQQISQSSWYEITLIVVGNKLKIIKNDVIFNDYNISDNDVYLCFIMENNTTIQTINIKEMNCQDLNGKIIFNDVGKNIHWTSDDDIERIFKDTYTQIKGIGYSRPNYDDVYTETKLYKNKNHMIEFDYKHNVDDFIIFNDIGTTSSHNTHYNKISGLLSYTSTNTVFTYTNEDILNLNYYIPQCELKGDWIIDFKLKTSNLSRTYFVFTNELRDTVPNNDDINDEQYKTNLTGLNVDVEYYFKILKNNNTIKIRYSINGNNYTDFKTLTVDEETLYFNFVLNGMNQYDVTMNFNNLKISSNNKISLVLSNYDHSTETLIESVNLFEDTNIKILLIGVKIFLLIDNVFIKSLIMEDDYAYTLFNFFLDNTIFNYNNFKMYLLNNNNGFELETETERTYTYKLDGTENVVTLMNGYEFTTGNGYGGGSNQVGYISDGFDNTGNWEMTMTLQTSSYDGGFTLLLNPYIPSDFDSCTETYKWDCIYKNKNSDVLQWIDGYIKINNSNNLTSIGIGYTRNITMNVKLIKNGTVLSYYENGILKGTYNWSKLSESDKIYIGVFNWNDRSVNKFSNVVFKTENQGGLINEESLYHYVIEVYNKLWTGEVTFDRLSPNEDIILYTDNKLNYNNETYIFHTICSDDDFDIILKLNNLYDEERIYEDVKPTIEYKDDTWVDKYKMFYTYKMTTSSDKNSYSYLYYQEPNITITVKDMYGQKLQGAKVIVPNTIYNGQTTLTTNSNGQVTFKPKRLKPGTYNGKVIIKKDPFDSEEKKITYSDTSINIQLKPKKEDLNVTYTKGATYWGGYVNDVFKVNANTNYQVDIILECGKSLINSKVNKKVNTNTSFTHEQSYRTKRLNESSITISVKATDWCNAFNKTFTKKHTLKYVDNWTQLKNEIDNTKGVDIVGLKNKNYIVDSNTIFYKRDIEIIGENTNDGWAVIKNADKFCFENKSPSKTNYINLKISNVEFYNNVKVFKHNAYANLEITNCLFYKNGKGKSNIGVCVETPITDTYISKNYGNIKISSCNFINNKGSNIGTSMNINIDTCRFGLNNWDYAQHPQCWAMEIYGQKATVKDCDFAVSMSGKSPLSVLKHSNFSHGKAILRIGTSAYVNGTKGTSCKKDNSSPLLSNGNTSYIYAKYKYDGVNVTASPTKNHERSAHDMVVNGTDWAWKNNVSVSTVYDNTKNKPTITVPKSPKDNAKILKKGGRQKW